MLSSLPAREALFGEVAINITLEVGVFSHNTYCSVARPGQLARVATMANMLQYQQWDEHIQEITWHKPVIVTTDHR
jgi:hypothetical protein